MSSIKEQLHELDKAMLALTEEEKETFLYCEDLIAGLTQEHGYPAHLALIYVDTMLKMSSEVWQAGVAMNAAANTPSPETLQ